MKNQSVRNITGQKPGSVFPEDNLMTRKYPLKSSLFAALSTVALGATFIGASVSTSAAAPPKTAAAPKTLVKLAGRIFRYQVGKYLIRVTFEAENRLRWTYLKAPGGETGKSATEKFDRTDLRSDVVLLAWTEKGGTHVTDIYDLRAMRLHVSMVYKGKRYFSKAKITEVTPR
jgi:hypothetical protein